MAFNSSSTLSTDFYDVNYNRHPHLFRALQFNHITADKQHLHRDFYDLAVQLATKLPPSANLELALTSLVFAKDALFVSTKVDDALYGLVDRKTVKAYFNTDQSISEAREFAVLFNNIKDKIFADEAKMGFKEGEAMMNGFNELFKAKNAAVRAVVEYVKR